MGDEEFFRELAESFPPGEVKIREYDGRPYVNARTVMDRLDQVCGPKNWWAKYEEWSEHAVLCRLTIRLPDGSELTKEDLGAYSSDQTRKGMGPGNRQKGGFSDALKRAAVQFGIGRDITSENYPAPRAAPPPPAKDVARGEIQWLGIPADGRELARRLQAFEGRGGGRGFVDTLTDHVREWGAAHGFPDDIRRWDHEQAGAGFKEARRFLGKARTTQ